MLVDNNHFFNKNVYELKGIIMASIFFHNLCRAIMLFVLQGTNTEFGENFTLRNLIHVIFSYASTERQT